VPKAWCLTPPAQPGFYWRRTAARRGAAEIVRIIEVRGAPHVLVCGTEGSTPLEEMGGRYSWHGPLAPPSR
jgi:hypothetical protein